MVKHSSAKDSRWRQTSKPRFLHSQNRRVLEKHLLKNLRIVSLVLGMSIAWLNLSPETANKESTSTRCGDVVGTRKRELGLTALFLHHASKEFTELAHWAGFKLQT